MPFDVLELGGRMKKKYLIILGFIVLSAGAAVQQEKFSFLNEKLAILKAFMENPSEVGTLAACSSFVGKEISKYIKKHIEDNPKKSIRVLEVGAGTGALTEEIMKILREEDHLDAVEISTQFCGVLNEKFKEYKNITVHCASILDWKSSRSYDFIVSTLPFNSFDVPFIIKVLDRYYGFIKPGGVLSYVEYIALAKVQRFCMGKVKKKEHKRRAKIMKNFRAKFGIDSKIVWLNLPLPINVYHLKINQERKVSV